MAAGHEEGNEREFGPASRKKRREQVSFEMMDPEHRDAQCFAERVGEGSANQQGSGETRALGIADALQIPRGAPGLAKDLAREGHQSLDVVARGEFRHHAAVGLVHGNLGMHGVADQAAFAAVVQRDAGFVARSLDSQHEHQPDFDTIPAPNEPRVGCRP